MSYSDPEDVAQPKPAPDMLQAALARLNIAADKALYVGDMGVDIQTARAAGVAVWVVPTGSDEIETLQRANRIDYCAIWESCAILWRADERPVLLLPRSHAE